MIAYRLRKEGLLFKDIGKQLNVGVARARQLYIAAERIVNAPFNSLKGLSARVENCLRNIGVENRQQALEAFKTFYNQGNDRTPRNYGWTSHKELAKWLGLPDPVKPRTNRRTSTTNAQEPTEDGR